MIFAGVAGNELDERADRTAGEVGAADRQTGQQSGKSEQQNRQLKPQGQRIRQQPNNVLRNRTVAAHMDLSIETT